MGFNILCGDILDKLSELENNTFDGVFCDELFYIEKRYKIRPEGYVIRRKTGCVTKFCLDHKGYLKGRLYVPELSSNKDRRKPYRLHRLIAMKYLSNFSKDLQVNHKNGDKTDNRVENLEMVTNAYNAKHGWELPCNKDRIKKLARDPITGKFITNKG